MRINHNSLALNASDHFATINKNIAKSMERLSSGKKITSPEDDAAGLAISTKMSAQIKGLNRAAQNSNDGISVIQSAEGGLEEIHNILQRMRELSVQAANDVNYEEDRDSIQEEINNLVEEINQITDTTAFNEQKLLNGNLTRRTLSSEPGISTTYLSESVNEGVYNITINAEGKQAVANTGLTYSNATIPDTAAGTVSVNGFSVEITAGMTMSDVFGRLQSHLYKIGVDVMATNDGGETEETFNSGAQVIFRTQEYGSEQKLDISVSNPELEAILGITSGTKVYGSDCDASIAVTDNGFSATATFTTKGNEVNIVDRNGFEMKLEVEHGTLANGAITASIEVLSAGTMIVQTGGNSGEQISIDIPSVSAKSLEIDNLSMYTHELAASAISAIDEAVKYVSSIRSKLGAYENRLEDIYDNLQIQEESVTAAYSRIMDTDMAEEMTNYTQQDVLGQAAISMMQKSNERPESILQLLQ